MCESCVGEVLVILHQRSWCGRSRAAWVMPSPYSLVGFSFALVNVIYFKV